MRIIWKFNPENPDDKERLTLYANAINTSSALRDILNYLRNKVKHGNFSETEFKAYEDIRNDVYKILVDNNVTED